MRRQRIKAWTLLGGTFAVGVALSLWFIDRAAYSNIRPEDYVGPEACVECHEKNHQENFDSWQDHSHRVMNQNPTEESVKGDFSGVHLDYQHGRVKFYRDGPRYMMSIYENGEFVRRHEVTRTIGSLYVQYYIGRQVDGPELRGQRIYSRESKLNFGYAINLKRWLPVIYLDSTVLAEREYQEGGRRSKHLFGAPKHLWNSSCLVCHNTYPYESRLLYIGPWRAGYPKEAVEWRGGAEYGGDQELKARARPIAAKELVTLGISCESCHFGGREHAIEKKEIRFVPTSPKLTIRHPVSKRPVESDRDDPFVINSVCAQCHNSQLNHYPNGSPAVNSNESMAQAGGACASVIKCTNCHSPHEQGPPSGSPDRESYIQACIDCHSQFEQPAARVAHTRHSDSVNCLDCHMPRTVAGLDTVVRSHQIGKPIDRKTIETASPNACNLCHLDRPITWTLSELDKGWSVEPPPHAQLETWYGGNLNLPSGEVWARSPSQFVRLSALEAAARSPHLKDRIAPLIRGLSDEFPFNRTLALVALERHVGRHVSEDEFDLVADAETRAQQLAALEGSLRAAGW